MADLSGNATSSAQVEEFLAGLLEEITSLIQDGHQVDWDEYATRYPEWAPRIRELVPAIQTLGDIGLSLSTSDSQHTAKHPSDSIPGTLGDFRIIREIGRGGMGVVYEAEQLSLKRRVALKVLPFASVLDERHLQRFRNESLAAASLKHPNIVQVYAVGCERGVHHYAMEYVEGQTLDAVIGELRRASGLDAGLKGERRTNASRLTQALCGGTLGNQPESLGEEPTVACEPRAPCPLPSAETRPSARLSTNISSHQGREFFRSVARLGVQAAEALEHAHQLGVVHRDIKPSNLMVDASGRLSIADFGLAMTQTDANLTMTGDVLGTLRYMSPEQAAGNNRVLDHRTDVYSLGGTLYELVTLRPAFTSADRQRLLQAVVDEDPPRPRQVNGAIPWDLETIILKAMAKDPAERYTTAGELAAELQRFLEDKPIEAKRPTLLARAAKWSRRHKPLVASVIAALLFSVFGLAAGTLLIGRAHLKTQAAYQAETEQRDRAEENLRLALQTLDEIYLQAVPDQLQRNPNIDDSDRELLRKALGFYEAFAQQNADHSEVRRETAHAYGRVGTIYEALGETSRAEAALSRAIELGERLVARYPADIQCRYDLAQAHLSLSSVLLWSDVFRENERALESCLRAVALLEGLADELPGERNYTSKLTYSLAQLGHLSRMDEDWKQAEKAMRRALAISRKLATDFPDSPDSHSCLVARCTDLGILLGKTGQVKEAEASYREAVAVVDREESTHTKPSAGMAYVRLGQLLGETGRVEDAAAVFQKAIDLQEFAIAAAPNNWGRHHELGSTLIDLAGLLKGDQPEEAARLYRRCLTIFDRLVDEVPTNYHYRKSAANSRYYLGGLSWKSGRLEDAEEYVRDACARYESLRAEVPEGGDKAVWSFNLLGMVLEEAGRLPEAIEAYERSTEFDPNHPFPHTGRARALRKAGRVPEAIEAYRRAMELDPNDAQAPNNLAWYLATSPDPQIRNADEAVKLAEKAVELDPNGASGWNTLGAAYYRAGDYEDAVRALRKSIELQGDNSYDFFFLAMAHWKLGHEKESRTCYQEAVGWMEDHRSDCDELRRFRQETEELTGWAATATQDSPP